MMHATASAACASVHRLVRGRGRGRGRASARARARARGAKD